MCKGARERIFDHFLSRSSAPTMLDKRVPMGSPFRLIRTHALSSNLIKLPSFRCISFFARTTTACRMSPLRTLFAIPRLEPPGLSAPKDLCFCTTTIIRSPAEEDTVSLETVTADDGWHTYPRMLGLFSHDLDAFNDGGPGIVDAIKERLHRVSNAIPCGSGTDLELYHRGSIM